MKLGSFLLAILVASACQKPPASTEKVDSSADGSGTNPGEGSEPGNGPESEDGADPVFDTNTPVLPASGAWELVNYAKDSNEGAEAVVLGGHFALFGSATYSTFMLVSASDLSFEITGDPLPPTGIPARVGHVMVAVGDKAVIWGGSNGSGTPHGDGVVFDLATRTFAKTSMTGAPPGRTNPVAVTDGSLIYVVGGFGPGHTKLPFGAWSYDPAADVWAEIVPATPIEGSVLHAVWNGSEIALFIREDYATKVRMLNPATGAVRDLAVPEENRFATMTSHRRIFASSGSKVAYVQDAYTQPRLSIFDIKSETWTTVAPPPGIDAKFNPSLGWVDDSLVVHAGCIKGSTPIRDVFRYEPDSKKWSSLPDLPTETRGQRAVLVSTEGTLLFAGGEYGSGCDAGRIAAYRFD